MTGCTYKRRFYDLVKSVEKHYENVDEDSLKGVTALLLSEKALMRIIEILKTAQKGQ